jgi:hypothetical protein
VNLAEVVISEVQSERGPQILPLRYVGLTRGEKEWAADKRRSTLIAAKAHGLLDLRESTFIGG